MTIDYTKINAPRPPAPPGNWWSRNWKWVVPVGCLTPLLLMGGCFAAIAIFVLGSIKDSGPYRDTVQRAQNDPGVAQALGAPIKTGWWVTGSVNLGADGDGTVDFQAPLLGTKTTGTLDVKGQSNNGRWDYSVLRVRVDEGPVIDLIPAADPSPAESTDTAPPAG